MCSEERETELVEEERSSVVSVRTAACNFLHVELVVSWLVVLSGGGGGGGAGVVLRSGGDGHGGGTSSAAHHVPQKLTERLLHLRLLQRGEVLRIQGSLQRRG